MPLASMQALLVAARAGGYAICYCESWNLESFQAVVAAADMECQKAYQVVGTGGYRESSIAIEMSTLSVCFLKEKSGRTFLQMAK